MGLDILEEEGSDGVTPGGPETLDSADNSLTQQMYADLNHQQCSNFNDKNATRFSFEKDQRIDPVNRSESLKIQQSMDEKNEDKN